MNEVGRLSEEDPEAGFGSVGALNELGVCLIGNGSAGDDDCCVRYEAAECADDLVIGRNVGVCVVDICDDKGDSSDSGSGSASMVEEVKEVNDDLVGGSDTGIMFEDLEERKDYKNGSFVAECGGFLALEKGVSVVLVDREKDDSDSHTYDDIGLCFDKGPDSERKITESSDLNEDCRACGVSVAIEEKMRMEKEENGELIAPHQENNCSVIEKGVHAEAAAVAVNDDCNCNNVDSFDVNRITQFVFHAQEDDRATSISVSFEQRKAVEDFNHGAALARQESLNLVAEHSTLAIGSIDMEQNHASSVCPNKSHLVDSELNTKEMLERPRSILVDKSEPSGSFPASNLLGNDSSAANMSLNHIARDAFGRQNGGARSHQNSAPLIVFRRSNPKRAASSRNIQTDGRYYQRGKAKKSVSETYKYGDMNMPLLNVINISKLAKKRSCLHRTARHSAWGEITSLIHCFMQTDVMRGYDFKSAQLQRKELYGDTSGKPQLTQKVRNSRLSMHRNAIFTDSMHVKNHKFGVVRTTANDIESSLTQDLSGGNMLGECPGVSSLVLSESIMNTHLLGPESSPDSIVYNPLLDSGVISTHVTTPALQNSELCETILASEIIFPEDLHAGALNSRKPSFSPDVASSADLYLQHKKESKHFDKECANRLSEQDPTKDTFDGTQNLTGGIKKYTRKGNQRKKHRLKENGPLPSKAAEKAIRKGTLSNSLTTDTTKVGVVELNCCAHPSGLDFNLESLELPLSNACNRESDDKVLLPFTKSKGTQVHYTSKKGVRKGKSSSFASTMGRQDGFRKLNKGVIQLHKSIMKEETKILDSSPETKDDMIIVSGPAEGTKHRCTSRKGFRKEKSSSSSSAKNRQEEFQQLDSAVIQRLLKSSIKGESKILDPSTEPKDENTLSGPASNDQVLMESCLGVDKEPYLQQSAWVQCDECNKWRCIPSELADRINETNCRWTCVDNGDKAFADCSIPQEKTNKEINLELGISDDEDMPNVISKSGIVDTRLEVSQSWTPIKTNLYLHRSRKTQTVDEIMVCNCKAPSDGNLGCRDRCLNRILNIECARGTCPCGDLCSNQQFQKRKYVKLKQILCGKKGFGLQLLQDVSCGQFVIEYVGEVLDLAAYGARQRYYASRGQKHFYFMTLKGGEVIDACAKGNLGRFINHSCDPNCRTEKWMVNGEVCIGLFALRDIKKGEEVTFDYNYERIFGAAAKKCICGSFACRGYLGGNPADSDVIVQGDSDDEYPEPVLDQKDNLKKLQKRGRDFAILQAEKTNDEDTALQRKYLIQSPRSSAIPESEISQKPLDNVCWSPSSCNEKHILVEQNDKDTMFHIADDVSMGNKEKETTFHIVDDVQILNSSLKSLNEGRIGEITCNPIFDTHLEVPSQTFIASSSSNSYSAEDTATYASNRIDSEPSCSHFKSSSSHSLKNSKPTAKSPISQKNKRVMGSQNSRSVVASSSHDGVERELNGLLSIDGGIIKCRDSIKGYLKLLNFTAAAGDNGGGASQSVRDLSLILDALLKTRSSRVLDDVINMNGWQLLHNILKQNRAKFNRTPIVRKLLKVLIDLAEKGILKPEHMDKSPPCSKMESFRDTIWALTKHNDNQVHHMAVDFKRRWLSHVIKRVGPSNKYDFQSESDHCQFNRHKTLPSRVQLDQETRNSDGMICVNEAEDGPASFMADKPGEASQDPGHSVQFSLPLNDDNHMSVKRVRKRKSRWDQPPEELNPKTFCFIQDQPEDLQNEKATMLQPAVGPRHQSVETQRTGANSVGECENVNDLMKCIDDGPPPGFDSPQNNNFIWVPEAKLLGSELGYPQQTYLPTLTVSYGMPLTLAQQLGTPEVGDNLTHQHQFWVVAPGIPFHPFPPLPPYSRENLDASKQIERTLAHRTRGNAKTRLGKRCHDDSQATDHVPSCTAREIPTDMADAKHRQKFVNDRYGNRFPNSGRWRNYRHQNHFHRWPRSREGNDCRFRDGIKGHSTRMTGNERIDLHP